MLKIGGREISISCAKDIIANYTQCPPTDSNHPFAYPFYELYQTDPIHLVDADLLAPVILNVPLKLKGYVSLHRMRPRLNEGLQAIAPDLTLEKATDEDFELIRQLYLPLDAEDGTRYPGIQGTTLSKVLHRKRPGFIPVYDEHVRRCYQGGDGYPIDVVRRRKRAWSQFMVLLARAMRHDLTTQAASWHHLTAEVGGPVPLTTLRCLDIIAWTVGRELPE